MPAIRLLLADDHPVYLDGLALRLGADSDLVVAATARTGEEAVRQAIDCRPDVAVLDVELPGIDGIEAARRLRAAAPGVLVLILTMHEDDERVAAALEAGAMGYVSKHAEPDEIVAAIRAVATGQLLFGAAVADRVRERLRAGGTARRPFPQLTGREHQVLDLLAARCDNAAIAGRLGISAKTVRNHVANVLAKLPAADRAEAGRQGRTAGLGR